MPEPIYHSEKMTYGSYLHLDKILGAQHPRSDPQQHDELLFIISHQVYELWFRQLIHEVGEINDFLDADEPLQALNVFERVHKIQHLLIEQIPLLETMFTVDFAQFRDELTPASGFQSVQFRVLEFLCGAKNEKMLKLVGEDEQARQRMAAHLDRPTIYDHFLKHLSRVGFEIPDSVLNRDVRKPHEPNEAILDAFEQLYRASRKYWPQFRVAEALLEFDEKFSIWRFHHVKMVERMIGTGSGTGGSSGAKYLRSTLAITFFPEIWMVRGRLAGRSGWGTVPTPTPGELVDGDQRSDGSGGDGGSGGCPMGY